MSVFWWKYYLCHFLCTAPCVMDVQHTNFRSYGKYKRLPLNSWCRSRFVKCKIQNSNKFSPSYSFVKGNYSLKRSDHICTCISDNRICSCPLASLCACISYVVGSLVAWLLFPLYFRRTIHNNSYVWSVGRHHQYTINLMTSFYYIYRLKSFCRSTSPPVTCKLIQNRVHVMEFVEIDTFSRSSVGMWHISF
jgi:hypothetical protein